MLRELVQVQGSLTAAHHDWQLHKGLLREICAQRGLGLGWQQNQHPEIPSSLSRVMTAESRAQLAWHFARPIVRRPA